MGWAGHQQVNGRRRGHGGRRDRERGRAIRKEARKQEPGPARSNGPGEERRHNDSEEEVELVMCDGDVHLSIRRERRGAALL